jgi:hypothetical protein
MTAINGNELRGTKTGTVDVDDVAFLKNIIWKFKKIAICKDKRQILQKLKILYLSFFLKLIFTFLGDCSGKIALQ